MKSPLPFLFSYSHLGWKGRLSVGDSLYHQGRLLLPFVFFGVPFMAMLFMTWFTMMMAGVPSWHNLQAMMVFPSFWLMLAVFLGSAAMFVYLCVQMVRLYILRLHDLNLSGWWLFSIIPLGFIDAFLAKNLIGSEMFFSTQNLALLALYIWPSSALAEARFGKAENAYADRRVIVKAIPLVLLALVWGAGIVHAFRTQNMQTLPYDMTSIYKAPDDALYLEDTSQPDPVSTTIND